MPIQLLSDDVVAKIAAGEVVERPASVVKELIENSLDAGADYIQIDVMNGGQRLIRISDNGSGIEAHELPLAVTRHATSKLQTAEDLYAIRTLGFRGEALASIAAVSRLTLVTRHRDEDLGHQIRVDGGQVEPARPVGVPAGTVISVENLFFNTPARLKFLRSENTEKRQITTVVTRYAMAYPKVRFVLLMDDRETFRSPGSGDLNDVVVRVLGLGTFKQMIEVEGEQLLRGGGRIRGYGLISLPELNRKDRSRIMIFVNGRAVQDNQLSYAVSQAYHGLLPKGNYPMAVLMLDVPADFVDVNVHPTKAEVRFRESDAVFAAIQRIVRPAIVGHTRTQYGYGNPRSSMVGPGWDRNTNISPGLLFTDDLVANNAAGSEQETLSQLDPTAIPDGPGRPRNPRTLPILRVVGQVGANYIVTEGPAGMYLIDQHAAHTRILYEQINTLRADSREIVSVPLDPVPVDVSSKEARRLENVIAFLETIGVLVEPFGAETFVIRALPQIAADVDPADLLAGIVRVLVAIQEDGIEDALVQVLCEHAAVRSGQILEHGQMRELVRQLERSPSPHTSPSGRPTLIHMSAEQLAREFSRPPD